MNINGIKGALNLVSPWMANTSDIDPPITIISGIKAFRYSLYFNKIKVPKKDNVRIIK